MLTTLHVSVLTMVARSVHRNSVNLVNMELSLGKLNFLHTRQFYRFFWHHGPAQNPHKVSTARPAQDSGCSSNGPGWSSNLFGRFDDAWLPRIGLSSHDPAPPRSCWCIGPVFNCASCLRVYKPKLYQPWKNQGVLCFSLRFPSLKDLNMNWCDSSKSDKDDVYGGSMGNPWNPLVIKLWRVI